MKNNYFKEKTKTVHSILLFFVCLFFTNTNWGQQVFEETFGTVGVVHPFTGGTSTPSLSYALTPTSGGTNCQVNSVSGNGILQIAFGTLATPYRGVLTGALSGYSAGYNTVLKNNTGAVRWSANLRSMVTSTTVSLSSDTSVGTRWYAIVLCSTNADFFASGATGYAILLNKGVANNVSAIKLVKFTNGLTSTSTLITSPDITNGMYLSTEVVYDPATQIWSMSYRNDGATAFADPLTGSLTSIGGTSSDSSYTNDVMTSFGFVTSLLSSNSNGAFFDNYRVKVDAPAVTPIITKSVATLSGFSTFSTTASAAQSFTVSGTNLTNNLVVTTASTDYELSTTSNFTSTTLPITLVPSTGTVASTPIYVRLKSGLSSGAKSGAISVSSIGANTLTDVTLNGSVLGAYYYDGSGSLSDVTNWGTNPDGSGSNPSDLLGSNTYFYIKNGSATTDASWTLGINSKVIVGDISNPAVTLSIADTFPIIGGAIDITAASIGSNSVIIQDNSSLISPVFGTLNANSEVHFEKAGVYNIGNPTFGKLFIDGGSGGTNIINNPVIQNSLTVASGSTMVTTSNTAAYFYFNSGATATINGFLWTTKANGLFSFSVGTPSSTGGSLQFADASPLTIDTNAIIGYSRNTTPIQTISVLPVGVNYTNLNVELTNIPNPIIVTGKLTVTGALTTNGNLTLKSTATRTAVVAPVVTGSITGNVIVERYIPATQRAYRLLSPATTGGTINANWQEGGLVTTVGGISDPKANYGTHLTGTGGSANGFDTTTTNAASIYTYSNGWNALANTNGTLNAGNPYLVYVRGSRQASNISASATNNATTLRSTGTLFTGNTPVINLVATANGFTAVGNPYQAQVDMAAVLAAGTNVNTNFYYVVDPSLGTKGAYLTVDVTDPATAHISKYLQPGQACFVKTVADGAASIAFTEANKSDVEAQTTIFKTRAISTPKLNISLFDGNSKLLDVMKITFDGSETNEINQNDAIKITNFDESMASSNNGVLLAIEKRAIPTNSDEIPMSITKYRGTSYTLKLNGSGLTETPYLVDNFTGVTTEIPQDGTVDYVYTVDASNASSSADRFKLIYGKTLNTVKTTVSGFAIYPNPTKSNSFNVVVPQSNSNATILVSNMLGQVLYSQNDLQSGTKAITVDNVKTAGVYLVSLSIDGNKTTTKWVVE